ncbi:MAG: hypothetical protein MjAS7_0938 [Metallosphaera javensis (ex Sakai et al. 2022)]|nr:MAG: hypothetical protein MjAS7_0938 [Metallosphaera javensis (ex Sakai et al. 2022)]
MMPTPEDKKSKLLAYYPGKNFSRARTLGLGYPERRNHLLKEPLGLELGGTQLILEPFTKCATD